MVADNYILNRQLGVEFGLSISRYTALPHPHQKSFHYYCSRYLRIHDNFQPQRPRRKPTYPHYYTSRYYQDLGIHFLHFQRERPRPTKYRSEQICTRQKN